TASSPSGAVPLLFARIIGRSQADVSALAQAAVGVRAYAIVVDTGVQMNDDSQLADDALTYSNDAKLFDMDAVASGKLNLHQIWTDLVANGAVSAGGLGNMTTWHTNAASMPTVTGSTSSVIDQLGLTNVSYPSSLGGAGGGGNQWNGYVKYVKNLKGVD